ncbi:MAG: hypothetical protein ACLRFI_03600 [Alphaproteobacteria bacterium]
MNKLIAFVLLFLITGCNSVYFTPNSLDTNREFYALRGGFTMRRQIKQTMAERGYKVRVGKLKNASSNENFDMETNYIPNKNVYVVKVVEKAEIFNPFWCIFNGFWWWRFNVSIADQNTGQELMSWRGRGCANSSIKKLENILNQMEMKK